MATNSDMLSAMVTYIERERGVSRETVIRAIEEAIKKAAGNNPDVTNDLRVSVDRNDFSLHVYDTMVVSDEDTGTGFISVAKARRIKPDVKEGDTIEIEMPASHLGRIAAQTSRQMIMQKIREAERTNTFSEFKGRIGEIVSGTVSGLNRRDVYVLVGRVEMVLPGRERIPSENYRVGDSLRAIVHSVKSADSSGPSVTLSRASNEFLRTLFRLEVSEIADGVVEIMNVARDPGFRAKIAVRTHDDKVDPVGACVGLKGARVREVVRELGGEKIDIVRWSDDPKTYIAQALAPAKFETMEIDPETSSVQVTVPPDQYPVAVGKRNQNVKLASRLTGWRIDVKKSISLTSFEEQKAEAIKALADTFSISTAQATQMADAGFLTVEGIIDTDVDSFAAATGFDEVTARGLYAAAMAVAEITGTASGGDEDGAEESADAPSGGAE